MTLNALVASGQRADSRTVQYFALEGLGKLLNTIKMTKTKAESGTGDRRVSANDVRLAAAAGQPSGRRSAGAFRRPGFRTIIQRNIRLSEAPSFGKPALLYDASSTGSINYLNLAKEFIKKNKS